MWSGVDDANVYICHSIYPEPRFLFKIMLLKIRKHSSVQVNTILVMDEIFDFNPKTNGFTQSDRF